MRVGELAVEVVGREPELAVLEDFAAADAGAGDSSRALVLTGGPGAGKTRLWEAGIELAREQGRLVLAARPSSGEAQFEFVALADLLDGVPAETFSALPAPQRHALDVALLRAEPAGEPAAWHAIAAGFLNVLRALAETQPLLVAIDDVHWLDPPSGDALAFAARRLQGRRVRFLLATRAGMPPVLRRALEPMDMIRLPVGPMSIGAIRRLLSERLALTLRRQVLRRLYDATAGNPLFALEVGRTLVDRGMPSPDEDLPVPDALEELLGTRVARLAAPVRQVLLALSLSGPMHRSQIAALVGEDVLDQAIDAAVVIVDSERVHPSHPVLAAAAAGCSGAGERRRLHRQIAAVVGEQERRARHLALATEGTDPELASVLEAAATRAAARGAAHDAVTLSEHALRLTPYELPARNERLLTLADRLNVAGESQRLTDLLAPQLNSLPAGRARVRAFTLLADGGEVRTFDEYNDYLDRAFAEAGDDPPLRAPALALRAEATLVARVERIGDAESWASEALGAHLVATEPLALFSLGWARSLRGLPIDDLVARDHGIGERGRELARSIDRVEAVRLMWRGEMARARARLAELASLADERGEAYSYLVMRLHLCEFALRAGEWRAVSAALDEWDEFGDRDELVGPVYERCHALLAAGLGFPEEAEQRAARAIAGAMANGIQWDLLEGRRARGIAALLAARPDDAADGLRTVWAHIEREGVEDPGTFPVAPDLVEALVESGQLTEAAKVTTRLRELAERQRHPWGLATAMRCEALVQLGAGCPDPDAAAAQLRRAAAEYERLGLLFDHARTLLSLGRAERRRRKWAGARGALELAATAFEKLGSGGWTVQARDELARVGARRPRSPGELTPSERRVLELAARGYANKEIAQALFITVKTVEAHLSHGYAKLGVRSRAQLAHRLHGE